MDRLLRIIEDRYSELLIRELNVFIKDNIDLEEFFIDEYNSTTDNIYANEDEICFDIKTSIRMHKIKETIIDKYFKENIVKNCYINCKCIISDDIKDFKIIDVGGDPHTSCNIKNGRLYGKNLVPKDKKYPMFQDVDELLKKYYTVDEINDFKEVPIRDIAEHMGLVIEENYKVSSKYKSQGMICMFDEELTLYNTVTKSEETKKFYAGTVFIDADYIRKHHNSKSCINFVLAHEIYHWLRHRPFILLRKIVSEDYGLGYSQICKDRTPFFWKDDDERVEVQANRFAQSLLLCHRDLVIRYENHLFKNEFYITTHQEAALDKTLKELSNYYNVSIMTLVLRLTVAGKYIDGFDKYTYDFHNKYDHYEIEAEELIDLCIRNKEIYDLLVKSKLVYYKKRLIINDDEQSYKHADFTDSKYLKTHCISFSFDFSGKNKIMVFALASNNVKKTATVDINKNAPVLSDAKVRKLVKNTIDLGNVDGMTFKELLKSLRENRGNITQEKMANLLHVDLRTYERYENGETPTPRDIIYQIIFILKVQPPYGIKLYNKAGYTFTGTKKDNVVSMLIGMAPFITHQKFLQAVSEAEE